ncbi:MAG: class I SAM-dependent methyltransferase, partial [Nanoarchaeota archaeon]|nr:class I SAM-dependent methyltransferase [Nanoarchaeota archaeon]
MNHYKNIDKCRVCNSNNLTEVINIDAQYLSPTFVESNEENELSQIKVPLTVVLCDKNKNGCGLVQLKETVNPNLLYTNYFYRTSVNDTMKRDLNELVVDLQKNVKLNNQDVVVDIGANDCTMLTYFPKNTIRIGVEPAKNINWSNLDKSIKVVNNYFSKTALMPALDGQKVKAFTCCAMFYDLDDPGSFVNDIKSLLAPDGVWCIQLSYIVLMLKNLNFYDICHEHLEYYSLRTLS